MNTRAIAEEKRMRKALRDNMVVSIDEILHGSYVYTQCTCIYCGKPVGADKNSNTPHFYHTEKTDRENCYKQRFEYK